MTINELVEFYKKIKIDAERSFNKEKKNIFRLGMLRLLVFLIGTGLVYFFWGDGVIVGISIIVSFLLFLFLLKLYNHAQNLRSYYEQSMLNAENEMKALDYDFSPFDDYSEMIDSDHNFSFDLDLFGENSFFQSINRTVTLYGKKKLADILKNPLSNSDEILIRQEQIKGLSEKPMFLLNFLNYGNIESVKGIDIKKITQFFIKDSLSKPLKNSFWRIGIYLMPVLSISSIVLYVLDYFSFLNFMSVWILLAILAALPIKRLNKSIGIWNKSTDLLKSYSNLLEMIAGYEDASLSPIIKNKDRGEAAVAIERLYKHIENFNQTFTFPGILFLNPLMMWDVKYAIKIEEWITKHGEDIEIWIDELAEFDALVSLALYAYNHPDYTYPKISGRRQFSAEDMGHPLLHRDRCVTNDVRINNHPYFLVVTGANMAGKSTYLRTIGINLVLASVGAPVFAKSLSFHPFELVTNLRTTDSLMENESYFFAELKRLKMIIDKLERGEELFIILDEILKGTNSEDKQKGSLALMKQLIAEKSCGIIATHDLLLGELEAEFPNEIKNYRFEADIKNEELSFSYKIREGVAENMNACFLMKKMGITGL